MESKLFQFFADSELSWRHNKTDTALPDIMPAKVSYMYIYEKHFNSMLFDSSLLWTTDV